MSHDIGVITTCGEETSAIVEAFGLRGGPRAAFDGEVELRRGAVRLVCVEGGEEAYGRMREAFAPPIVALVGVAGRAAAGVRHGDVVVSDEAVRGSGTTVTPGVMRRAVNHFFSIQGEPIEWGEGPYRVLRGRIGHRTGEDGILAVDPPRSDLAHAYRAAGDVDPAAPLHGWVAVLGIAGGSAPRGLAARHAAMVFGAMLPVLGRRPSLIGARS